MMRPNPLPEFPTNLLEFQRQFPDEAACLRYLEQVRWPEGFVCPKCNAVGEPFRSTKRLRVLKCRACRHETTVTAQTIMHRTKTSLHIWFWAAYLVATSTPGISALEIQTKLGIPRYETSFQIMHKLRSAMVRPHRGTIGGEHAVELDVAYVGGKHKGDPTPGEYRKTKKTPVMVAVEIVEGELPPKGAMHRDGTPLEQKFYAGRIRLRKVPDKAAKTVAQFAIDCITPESLILSDAGTEFTALKKLGYSHAPLALRGSHDAAEAWVPTVHLVIGNLKAWIIGTFHGVRKQHLQAYLNEFVFRFNRRFARPLSFQQLLGVGSHQEGPTYRELYDRDWTHRENGGLENECGPTG